MHSARLRLLVVAYAMAGFTGCGGSPGAATVVDSSGPQIFCPAPPDAVQATDSSGGIVIFGSASASGGAAPLTGPTCSKVSGTVFPVGTTTVVCSVSDSKSRSNSCSFPVVVTQAAAVPRLAVTKFLAFGDSITWGDDGSMTSSSPFDRNARLRPGKRVDDNQTYTALLESALRGYYRAQTPRVQNEGAQRERVLDPLTRKRFQTDVLSGSYDAVLLLEGVNDLADGAEISAVVSGLRDLARDAANAGVRTVLATLPPERPGGARAYVVGIVTTFNDQLKAAAQRENIPVVDVYSAFGGDVTTLIGPDGLHPSAKGYQVMANAFLAKIKETLEAPSASTSTVRAPFVIAPPRR
jgi:lysophospholipase L1-like esterase